MKHVSLVFTEIGDRHHSAPDTERSEEDRCGSAVNTVTRPLSLKHSKDGLREVETCKEMDAEPQEGKTMDPNTTIINEAQLILAEKRTSLATMRTGMAVFAIPLSIIGLLIATSRYYDILHVLHFIVPLTAILAALIVLGAHLVARAFLQIRRLDRLILRLKRKHSRIAEFLD